MLIKWKPSWYELDQSIVTDDVGLFYLAKDKSQFANDRASYNDYEVLAKIIKIKHEQLGIIKGILTIGLDYSIFLEDGKKLIVNAEESPGKIYESDIAMKDWTFLVEIEINEETGLSSAERIDKMSRTELKNLYLKSQENYKRLLGLDEL